MAGRNRGEARGLFLNLKVRRCLHVKFAFQTAVKSTANLKALRNFKGENSADCEVLSYGARRMQVVSESGRATNRANGQLLIRYVDRAIKRNVDARSATRTDRQTHAQAVSLTESPVNVAADCVTVYSAL